MPYIEDAADLEWYQDKFGEIWQSATLRCSVVDVEGIQIPNGEVSFSRESGEEGVELLYREGPLSIYEVVSNSPFELLEQVIRGKLPMDGEPAEFDGKFRGHNPGYYFQDGMPEGRVRDTRPHLEVNAAIDIEVPERIEDSYSKGIDQLEDQLMRAEEPYYDLGRCEGYYFDYIFRSDRSNPAILLFADSGLEFDITDSDELELTIPSALVDDLFVTVLPQRPYDEHKGWKRDLNDEQLETLADGRSRYTENLELTGIEELYAILYLGERSITMIEHSSGDVLPENPRYEIMRAFDQANNLEGYLAGHDANQFEVAVANALSTAGWIVQWYGDDNFSIPSFSEEVPGARPHEIDIIAYHPENTQILFIECTNQDISQKEQVLDRTEAIRSELDDYLISTDIGLFEQRETIPCVATPQDPGELSGDVVADFDSKNIKILHRERLLAIYSASQDTTEAVSPDTEFIEVI